jgi:L-aminopeptidase/D-esterase-like protein
MGIDGLRIGHATSDDRTSGVTVACFENAVRTVVQIRGGASATFDTGSLALDATFGRRWAIFFTGGSLFGLDAARGVRTALLHHGAGRTVFSSGFRIAPIAGAALFDLRSTRGPLPEYAMLGERAAHSARAQRPAEGRVGAGAGATVGKYLGRGHSMPGGIGWSSRITSEGYRIAALVAVNAVGAIRGDGKRRWLAGARGSRGEIVPPAGRWATATPGSGTTLALIVTDAPLSRPELSRVVTMAEGGLASIIVPYGSATDGDVTFGATTAPEEARPNSGIPTSQVDSLGIGAAECAGTAVQRAVTAPESGERTRETEGWAPRERASRRGGSASRLRGSPSR